MSGSITKAKRGLRPKRNGGSMPKKKGGKKKGGMKRY